MPSPPPFPPLRAPISPSSTDSNVDVTAYAEERDRVYEHAQGFVTTQSIDPASKDSGKTGEPEEPEMREVVQSQENTTTNASPITLTQTDPLPPFIRTSTPTQGASNVVPEMNLTQLESGLRVATSSRTTLPEILPAVHPANETPAVSFLQTETDDSSFVCDVPELPQGEDDGTSHLSCPELYGFLPVPQNASSCVEDTLTHAPNDPTTQAGPSTAGLSCHEPRDLSGRSRAILKKYFDEDAAIVSLPLGHRTVAFTEPQVYHLLRVLTNETLQMSYTTMKKMVLGAVRGAPVTAESRTDHFKIRNRAQTPHPRHLSESSDGTRGEHDSGPGTDSTGEHHTESEDGVFDSCNETDSSA